MRNKSFKVFFSLVFLSAILLTGCGSEAGQSNSDGQITGQPKDAEQEQLNAVVESEEDVWVPDEFVVNENLEIDFVAPAAHTGNGEQCTFMWSYTEEELKNWFLEKYACMEGTTRESVRNNEEIQNDNNIIYKNYFRSYGISKQDTSCSASISMNLGNYNESVVEKLDFSIKSDCQATVIADSTAILEMLGFGDCAEDIIHKNSSIKIPTENNRGYYEIHSSYGTDKYSRKYGMSLSIRYFDMNYRKAWSAQNPPPNFEYWDDYFALGDYLKNTEFDTSSLAAFDKEEKAYIEELYGNIYNQEISLNQDFFYIRYDFDKLRDVEFEYYSSCEDEHGNKGILSLKHMQEIRSEQESYVDFDISCWGRQPFEDREEKRRIDEGEDLSVAEIEELCEARYKLMKKLDGSIDWNMKDLINLFREWEFEEECDKIHFQGNGYEYRIFNDLEGISLYGTF